jgi:hypothetical protein
MSAQETFGYISAWSKGTLGTLLEEYEIDNGIMMSGKIKVKPDQGQQLIEYLSNPGNYDAYGAVLDFALFYDEDKPVNISGSVKTPYVKESGTSTKSATSRAKRQI